MVEKSSLFGRYALLLQRVGNMQAVILPLMLLLLFYNWTDMGVDHERIAVDQLRARVGLLIRITTHE
jgi:hypothetical protein